jgi:hypothetical protein
MTTITYARGRDWHIEARKPRGGFCFIHEHSIHAVWACLRSGDIELREVRVWLACHELTARRCTLEADRTPRYSVEELHGLVGGVGGEHVRRSVCRLEKHGLLRFSEDAIDTVPYEVQQHPGRPIPVPRPVLRLLAKSRGRAFIATVLGHLLRCVFYKNGVCRSGGWCKASWVAEAFGVAIRAVKEARARLLKLGLLRSVAADQLRLNRLGSPQVVSLDWGSKPAPRQRQSTTESAPPEKHKELSSRRVDHQKPARAAGPAGARLRAKDPDLNNVTEADLQDPWRLAALFKQARLRGWVRKTEAEILAVFAAAAHALRKGVRNPPGLFRWLLEKQSFSYATVADEDRGRHFIRILREGHGRSVALRPNASR